MDNEQSNPWLELSSINRFDRGSARTTVCVNSENETNGQMIKLNSPSTNFLIESLVRQLCALFENDTSRRNKLYHVICNKLHALNLIDDTYNSMEFEMLRMQYQKALNHLVTVAQAQNGSESALQGPRCLIYEWSRYHTEFQQLSYIAGGAFGSVYKVLHHLDGTEYAIKKIHVRSNCMKTIMQVLEEVKTLAKLNHPNIVTYKGAWIEPTFLSNFLSTLPAADSSKQILSENLSIEDSHSFVSFRNSNEDSHSTSSDSNKSKSNEESTVSEYNSCQKEQYTVLYIQMALCENTLSQWLTDRIGETPLPLVTTILTQILSGLEYIHSLGIVHHDIKPSNIFITNSPQLRLQIGDFGLACLQIQMNNDHFVRGTQLYAAPEQLRGKCDPKSDIYSLGIIILELLIPMETVMEQTVVISNIKKGQMPANLTINHPKWAQLIVRLIQSDPVKRPTSSELLREITEDKDAIIERLKLTIIQKDEKIEELEKEISSLKLSINSRKE